MESCLNSNSITRTFVGGRGGERGEGGREMGSGVNVSPDGHMHDNSRWPYVTASVRSHDPHQVAM